MAQHREVKQLFADHLCIFRFCLCRKGFYKRMTRVQKETGVGRVLRSAAGCAVLILAALAGVLVFLFSGGDAAREWPGALMLLAAGALAFGTAAYFRGIFRRLEEKNA